MNRMIFVVMMALITTLVVAATATIFETGTLQQKAYAAHGYGPGCDTGYHWNSDTGECVEN